MCLIRAKHPWYIDSHYVSSIIDTRQYFGLEYVRIESWKKTFLTIFLITVSLIFCNFYLKTRKEKYLDKIPLLYMQKLACWSFLLSYSFF